MFRLQQRLFVDQRCVSYFGNLGQLYCTDFNELRAIYVGSWSKIPSKNGKLMIHTTLKANNSHTQNYRDIFPIFLSFRNSGA